MELKKILEKLGALTADGNFSFRQFMHEEDDAPYDVYEITILGQKSVLKKAKAYETEVYNAFFSHAPSYVPKIYAITQWQEDCYLWVEHISGENLQKCNRESLRLALDALIDMQSEHWGSEMVDCGYPLQTSRTQRKMRGEYLNDPILKQAYSRFLECYDTTPRTLCHDDFLPFQVIVSENRAVMIDWEYGGILPYPVSLARLIAHGSEDAESLFFMTEDDKEFAVQYYYEHLIRKKGILFDDYRRTLDYFLFYEYCEWVYVGNKFGNTENEYFKRYLPMAKAAAERLLEGPLDGCGF